MVAEWRQKDPMLDLSLFKRPAMVGVSVATFAIAASIFAMFLYLTLYIQDVLGYGPLAAGLRFLPLTLLIFVVAPIAGKLTVKIQARYLMGTAMLVITVGLLLMAHVKADSSWTVLLPGFLLCGIGSGAANPVMASASVAVVPPERSGMASGSSNTFRQVGIATGIAGLGAVFQSQVQTKTLAALQATAAGRQVARHGGSQLTAAITGGGVRSVSATLAPPARQALLGAYRVGFTATLNHLMIIAAVIAAVGSVAAFGLVRQRDFVPSFAPSEPGGEVEPAPIPAL
jgi:MFS family permease